MYFMGCNKLSNRKNQSRINTEYIDGGHDFKLPESYQYFK